MATTYNAIEADVNTLKTVNWYDTEFNKLAICLLQQIQNQIKGTDT